MIKLSNAQDSIVSDESSLSQLTEALRRGCSILRDDGTISPTSLDKNTVQEVLKELSRIESPSFGSAAREHISREAMDRLKEELKRDLLLRILGLNNSQGDQSATCGVSVQQLKLIEHDPGRFVREVLDLVDKGFYREAQSGRVVKLKPEALYADSNSVSSEFSHVKERLAAGRIWDLANLELDNGVNFDLSISSFETEQSINTSGMAGYPSKFTGQPDHWIVNGYRARFGVNYSADYNDGNLEERFKSGLYNNELCSVSLNGDGSKKHIVLISHVETDENGEMRVYVRDTQLHRTSDNRSIYQKLLVKGARGEGHDTWSVPLSRFLGSDGEPPILRFAMSRKSTPQEDMTENQDRALIDYRAKEYNFGSALTYYEFMSPYSEANTRKSLQISPSSPMKPLFQSLGFDKPSFKGV